jgi:hypothetical protein
MNSKYQNHPMEIGWREWVTLPGLKVPAIKAKIDTGARTSALHTFHIETFSEQGVEKVRFKLHPLQRNTDLVIECISPVIDTRTVKDSGGHAEERIVIETPLKIGDREWPIEITLTNRDDMMFRMLLGRTAIKGGNLLVSPGKSYINGRSLRKAYK